jgi:Fe-S cluster assembly scaffold protein SufB
VAAHGASIGAIDEEMFYYLMSRGISRTDAERLVIAGFINPFLLLRLAKKSSQGLDFGH